MNEQHGISPWKWLLCSSQTDWITDIHYNMNWAQKKPDMKGQISYDSIYMRCSNRPIYGDRKHIILPEPEG